MRCDGTHFQKVLLFIGMLDGKIHFPCRGGERVGSGTPNALFLEHGNGPFVLFRHSGVYGIALKHGCIGPIFVLASLVASLRDTVLPYYILVYCATGKTKQQQARCYRRCLCVFVFQMLIQVQFIKRELLIATTAIGQLARENELNLRIMATVPAFLLAWGSYRAGRCFTLLSKLAWFVSK